MLFTFKYASPLVMPDSGTFTEEAAAKLEETIKYAAKEICIDKTYVNFVDTKYEKTFISENGWKELCRILDLTGFGQNVDKELNDMIQESYRQMIV